MPNPHVGSMHTGWTEAEGKRRRQYRIRHTWLPLAGVRVLRLLVRVRSFAGTCTDARIEAGSLQGR